MKHFYRYFLLLFFASVYSQNNLADTKIAISTEASIKPVGVTAYSLRDSFDLLDNVRDEFKNEITKKIKGMKIPGIKMVDIEVTMYDDFTIEKSFNGSTTTLRLIAPGGKIKWKVGGVCAGITRPSVKINYDRITLTKSVSSSGTSFSATAFSNLRTEYRPGINACAWLTMSVLLNDGFGFNDTEAWISNMFREAITKKIEKKLGFNDPLTSAVGGDLILNGVKSIPSGHSIFDILGGKEVVISYLEETFSGSKVTVLLLEDGLSRDEDVDDLLHIIIER